MNKIKIIPIQQLKIHEKIDKKNLAKIQSQILKDGYLNNPIIVDKDHFIILDGHHRTHSLLDLGYKKIPIYLVDYCSRKIRVISRRPGIMINKKKIIRHALAGKPYPHKTSKHLIPNRPQSLRIPLTKLL